MVKKKQRKSNGRKSSQPLPQVTVGKFEVLGTPTKDQNDKREYKVIRLENGLTACLISDENVKLAAASLCVGVGSFSDPKEAPGLAHILEHMVSMGSKKFPKENDFNAYIDKHGGSDNATTVYEITKFYFDCFDKYLYQSLDKFSQFFISPLIKKKSMIRERKAVESEFQNLIDCDEERKEQLLVSFAKESSSVTNFSFGNMKTLHENVDDHRLCTLLHKFRKQHYSANRMTLAVQANLPLELLERYVVNCFSKVPNNKFPTPDLKCPNDDNSDIFNTPQFKKAYYIKPVENLQQIELTWMLPPIRHLYKSKPAEYVFLLLLHKGPGSLLSYLKNRLWALAISGECNAFISSMYTHFSVTITLTAEGLLHLTEVVQAVFGYIRMLQEMIPDERIFKELQLIAQIEFYFTEIKDPCSNVEVFSENMQYYPPEDYLTGRRLFFNYQPKEITNVVNALVPEYMNMLILASGNPYQMNYDQVERYFGTKYCALDFKESWMKMWNGVARMPEFYLPNPNPFITDDFSSLTDKLTYTRYPVKVLDSPLAELWYKGDKHRVFADYYYNFIIPFAVKSIKNACLLDIFRLILKTNFEEKGYDATIAGLTFTISAMDKGICLKVTGYNQKLPALINTIAQYMVNVGPSLNKDLFNVIKEQLGQIYHNEILKPSIVCSELHLSIVQHNYFPKYDKHAVLDKITFDDMKEFSSQIFKNVYLKCLVRGNVEKSTAIDTTNRLIDILKCAPIESADFPKMLIYEIPNGDHCCRVMSFNKQSPTSVITNYYETGLFTLKDKVIGDIVKSILKEPFYDILRTKEQLGYDIDNSVHDTCGVLGISFTVLAQINKYKTDYIDSRIEAFLHNQYTAFKSNGKQKFDTARRGLIKLKEGVWCASYWEEIILNRYMFDRCDQEMKILEAININEVQQWWYEHFTFSKDSKFRKITFQVVGHPSSSDGDNKAFQGETFKLEMLQYEREIQNKGANYFIQDVEKFQRNLSLAISC